MFIELVSIIILLIFIRYFLLKSKAERFLEQIPGPKCYPLIGSLLEFDYPRVEVTDTFIQLSYKYGPVYVMKVGFETCVCIRSPKDFEVVLGSTSMIDKPPLYWPLIPWLNQGLLTSGGDHWRRHRKVLTPTFHFRVLERFVPVFNKNANILVNQLMTKLDKEFNVMPVIALCSLDIISETAMGLEINAQTKESEYVRAVNELQEIIAHRNFNVLHRSFLFGWLPVGRRHDQLISYLHKFTENVMKERKAALEAREEHVDKSNADLDMGIKDRKAFLDLILEYNRDGAGWSDLEIREEVDTFTFEGYDTTTSTLSFCLYCISQNQHVQDKIYEEIKGIFGDSDREGTYQDFQEMKYLEKVLKETLRRYATVQFIGRKTDKDVQLNSGYMIPENTTVIILIEGMNLDPEIHKDPLIFDPERFDGKQSNPYSFVPFSAGSRNCIGQKYAMLEMKVVISQILRRFCVLPSDIPIVTWFNIVLKSKTGVNMSFKLRPNN